MLLGATKQIVTLMEDPYREVQGSSPVRVMNVVGVVLLVDSSKRI